MHPWLLYTDHLRLPAYFTCLMVGFALATSVLRTGARRAQRRGVHGVTARVIFDTALLAVPMVLLGARLAHIVFVEPSLYWADPMELIRLDNGGFVFYGGLAMGAMTVFFRARRLGIDPWAMGDIFAPAVPFGLIFGRLGCLGGGCCYGKPASWPLGIDVPWAITYVRRNQVPDALMGIPVHPAPLYAMLVALGLYAGLSWWQQRSRRSGETMLLFVAGYGLARATLELFRADESRGLYMGDLVSTSQLIGLASCAVALILLWSRHVPDLDHHRWN